MLLDRKPPSPDAARTFLRFFHDEDLVEKARKAAEDAGERSYVPEENAPLRALGEVNTQLVSRIADSKLGTSATLDHDATVIESHKQEAKAHYKGGRGYQPAFVLFTEQGLAIADAFRDGNVPAGKDNLRLIRHAFLALSRVGDRAQRSLRVSACYDETVLKWLANPLSEDAIRGHIGFTISADMTKQLNACGKAVSDERSDAEPNAPFWQMLDDTRPNETAWWSEVEFTPGDWPRTATPLTLPRGPIPQASGRSVRQRSVRQVPGHRHQPRGKGRSAHPMALAEGRHHRALPRRDQERSRRRCHALRRVRGRARPGTASSDITYNILTVLKRHLLPPAEQTIKAKRLRFLAFNLAARMTSHARYLCSHVKAALLHGLAIAETRLELRLRREESHGRLGFAFAAPF